jgi:stress-induced morphogen
MLRRIIARRGYRETLSLSRRVLSTKAKVMEEQIITKLTNALAPVHLEVVNESYKHNAPTGAESHFFTVFVVSGSFDGKNVMARVW